MSTLLNFIGMHCLLALRTFKDKILKMTNPLTFFF